MAQIIPAGWREVATTGAALREIETLQRLASGLTDAFTVYHGVHWTNVERGYSVYGEIDFIVLAPNGQLLMIEQKSGFLSETPEGLVKKYPGKDKLVHTQIMRTLSALMTRFSRGGEHLSIDYLLYCPDYRVKEVHMAGIDAARIVDASRADRLVSIVEQLLPLDEEPIQRKKVERFLGDTLALHPDPSAMIGQAGQLVTRLAGGLATWARQLEFAPFRLRVIGTAGSGKTQLALAEFGAAIAAGKRPLYVCYNRPLADHVARLLPSGGRVASFHALCDSFARDQGKSPDYTQPDTWRALESSFGTADIPAEWRFDVLIVDEGQDFATPWRDALLRLLRPEGRAIWMEDPLQNLYGQTPTTLPGWVTLQAQTNFRSPRQVIELLQQLGGSALQIDAGSPFLGADIEVLTYPNGNVERMYYQTKHAITLCLGAGFMRGDMALVSFRGREHSDILHLDALGTHSLHSFTGDYDWFGVPVFRAGEIVAESVYRFKGQSAPAVIFTEIDFATLDERTFKKLFVGMTRARLKLVLVMSEAAEAAMMMRVQA